MSFTIATLVKNALTAYGKVSTDWLRVTAARITFEGIEGTFTLFVRADGSNSVIPTLPTVFRTSGDIANVAATLGHRVDFAAVPSVGLPNHTWKGTYTITEIGEKFGVSGDEIVASYARLEELFA